MRRFLDNVLKALNNINIKVLTTLPVVVGLTFSIVALLISERFFATVNPDIYLATIGIVSALLFSMSGIFQIYRRESPGILGGTIRGIGPIILGGIWVAFTWAIALFLLYNLF